MQVKEIKVIIGFNAKIEFQNIYEVIEKENCPNLPSHRPLSFYQVTGVYHENKTMMDRCDAWTSICHDTDTYTKMSKTIKISSMRIQILYIFKNIHIYIHMHIQFFYTRVCVYKFVPNIINPTYNPTITIL